MNESHMCDKLSLHIKKIVRSIKLLNVPGKYNRRGEKTLEFVGGQDGDIGVIWIKPCPSLTKSHLLARIMTWTYGYLENHTKHTQV